LLLGLFFLTTGTSIDMQVNLNSFMTDMTWLYRLSLQC
jgi:Kef-type K+ transport system membrane component KefB